MAILVGADDVGKEWAGRQVLEGVTCSVNDGDRIGVVGVNGGGKSTLLSLLAKRSEPDAGGVVWRHNLRVGLLGQTDALDDGDSVGRAVVGDAPAFEWASDARVRGILSHLVGDLDWEAPVGTLSGGERRRTDLARLLVGSWDVLLLDEPTNHLDMAGITWLAAHLKGRWRAGEGGLVVVTHDRWFLDEVCERMWEVHDGGLEPFEGGYSAYVQQRVERDAQAASAEARRQNALRKELNWLSHGAKARTSKPRFRVEAARALVAQDPPIRNTLELRRLAMARLGKTVIECRGVGISYGGSRVLSGLDWIVGPGERIGIMGANGAGKSSLLRVLTGRQAPSEGSVKIGASVRFGWLSQQMDIFEDSLGRSVLDVLGDYRREVMVDGKPTSSTKLLERLGFDERQLPTRLGELSGGERRRLAILCVLLREPNVLVLDEPGNDLDTDMLSVLEDLLDGWPGTLLLVTHDRYLMERVTDDQYGLVGGRLVHMPGGVEQFLELSAQARPGGPAGQGGGAQGVAGERGGACVPPPGARERKEQNQRRREAKRRLDAVARKLERVEGEPRRLRDELAAIDPTDYEALVAKQAEVDAAERELSALEDEWLELSDELGE